MARFGVLLRSPCLYYNTSKSSARPRACREVCPGLKQADPCVHTHTHTLAHTLGLAVTALALHRRLGPKTPSHESLLDQRSPRNPPNWFRWHCTYLLHNAQGQRLPLLGAVQTTVIPDTVRLQTSLHFAAVQRLPMAKASAQETSSHQTHFHRSSMQSLIDCRVSVARARKHNTAEMCL